ncbi:very short patch repair endonuclease [Xenorhabdus beddingii]|uniref:Very short patch repair endonuclease n=1 Tax=Xenorhabdus beddingii TaxID=40578 RepID=A0A1Y2SMJ6_9GAMM|nr:DNA mismatch endonuclease Vsr [Xenorhabdus beddingii]OTA19797.1 very short patch repair endonuclease [Xenorhabdus beddingii]
MRRANDPELRSKIMRSIKSSGTSIEKEIEKLIDNLGINYRKQEKILFGKPDFIIDEYQAILFVNGCFWHGHECHIFKVPKTRTEFWLKKINKNIYRDYIFINSLLNEGWRVLIIWECSLRGRYKLPRLELSRRIEEWLCEGNTCAEINFKGIYEISF